MDDTNQIAQHIQETRQDLTGNFRELEEKVKSAVDWRAQFQDRPMTLIALAFGAGALGSAILPSGRSSNRQYSGATAPEAASSSRSLQAYSSSNSKASHALVAWDAFKNALIGVATAKLTGVVEELVPGFETEFNKAKGSRGTNGSNGQSNLHT